MPAETKNVSFAEDEFGRKLDRCISDSIVKGTGGLLIGAVASVVFLKRRTWPLLVGTGFGIGIAYKSCEKDLNSQYQVK